MRRMMRRARRAAEEGKTLPGGGAEQSQSLAGGAEQRQPPAGPSGPPLSKSLDENVQAVLEAFGRSADLVVRQVRLGGTDLGDADGPAGESRVRSEPGVVTGEPGLRRLGVKAGPRAAVLHFDGLVDKKLVSDNIVKPLTGQGFAGRELEWIAGPSGPARAFEAVKSGYVTITEVREVTDLPALLSHMSSGDCVVLIDGHPVALSCSVRGWAERGIEESPSESTVRGPRDSFNETLRTNTGFIRRRIKDPRLRIDEIRIGRLTQTAVDVVYVEGLAPRGLVAEVRTRLSRIDIDGVVESGYLEEFIEDDPNSPFPQLIRTERPDRVVGCLLEGRVAILTDGTPFALIVPVGLTMFITATEDYYERYFIGSFLGLTRFASFFIALILPSLYIAVTTFHQELLPTPLILSIAAQREGVPFPAFIEALLLELSFDVLREAGVRLPRLVGPTISIVGVLVIGQAAVQAGLVSPFMVIIVAFTGIASYATPFYNLGLSVRILRYGVMALAASLGLFGIIAAVSLLLIHLCALRSFGQPYLSPLGPLVVPDLKDAIVRAPWWALDTRPFAARRTNYRRQKQGLRPHPPGRPGHQSDGAPPGGR